jgi:hypothetical protein
LSKNDDITIDFKSIKQKTKNTYESAKKFSKDNSGLITTILLVLLMITAFNVRAQPYDLGYVDDIARNYVEGQYKQQIFDQIRQQNPALSTSAINSRVETEWKNFYAANKDNIERDVSNLGNEFKQNFIGPDGQTYILDIDTHYWWQLTRQYFETGYVFDTVLDNGTMIDSYQIAPLRKRWKETMNLHPVYSAWHLQIIIMVYRMERYINHLI